MNRCLSVLGSVCLAAAVAAAPADDKKASAGDAERLVKQLGSARHADREAAAKALDALGPAALSALRAGVKSGDAEISRRAGELLAKLDRQAESAAALAATKVHLKVADAPLAEVIREFTRQSKMRIDVAREPVELPGRRITLDTGATGPWEALDALCRAAKVSIRPNVIDPNGTESPLVSTAIVPAQIAGVPAAAAGGGVVFTTSSRFATEEPLVLQDGALPDYPTTIIGAVRVRLIPERWANRDRKPGDEMKWTLEILTEPRVQWVGRPSFRFNAAPGLRADATPSAADETPRTATRVLTSSSSLVRMLGDAARGPSRHELPVYVKADAAVGTVAELTGSLGGTVQAPVGELVRVSDASKPKATAASKDGIRMTILESERADDGTVTLKVELERPGGIGAATRVTLPGGVRRAGTNGMIPSSAVRAMTGVSGIESFKLTDEGGRPYEVTVTRAEVAPRNGLTVGTFTLECEPSPRAAGPKVLELVGPRSVPVEAAFTLRNVPGR